ncbi:MAG: putative phosphoglucosamine mutase [Pseudomonadota bacterium]
MSRQYFGTDGIRGKVGQAPITPDFVMLLAHAVGRVLKRSESKPRVLIGKDTRISGYMLESAMEAGFNAAGVDVLLLGPVPTPAVAYLTRAQRASLGVVISASHNPFDDNGIKFFNALGTKLPDAWETQVEEELQSPPVWSSSANLGKSRRLDDAAGRYIEFCKSTFDKQLTLKGLKLVVDAAHGAAYQIAPKVFHELGAEVVSMGCQPDGYNINEAVGATSPQALIDKVLQCGADIGIALDGDADRLQIVGPQGRLFNGDELLYVMTMDRLLRGEKVEGVVGTLMTNQSIELALQKQGLQLVRAKVGDRYVLEELEKRGWLLGGESSGHLLALDKHSTGDGLISTLQVLQACLHQHKTLEELLQGVALFPQHMINVRLNEATQGWQQHQAFQSKLKEIEHQLLDQGRVLIRASGTEPVLRVMVEAATQELAVQSCESLVEVLV